MGRALKRAGSSDFPSITQYNAEHPRYEGGDPFSMLLQHRRFIRRMKQLKQFPERQVRGSAVSAR